MFGRSSRDPQAADPATGETGPAVPSLEETQALLDSLLAALIEHRAEPDTVQTRAKVVLAHLKVTGQLPGPVATLMPLLSQRLSALPSEAFRIELDRIAAYVRFIQSAAE